MSSSSGKKKSQIREINDYQQINDAFSQLDEDPLAAIISLGDLARQENFRALIIKHGGIEKLAPFMDHKSEEILLKTIRAFVNLTYENNEAALKITQLKPEHGTVQMLVKYMMLDNAPELQRNAVALSANLLHEDGTWSVLLFFYTKLTFLCYYVI